MEEQEKRYHRIRFYEGGWSNFDEIYEHKDRGCIGCMYKHPFCTEHGKVIAVATVKT